MKGWILRARLSSINQIYGKFPLTPFANPEIKAHYAYQGYAEVRERVMQEARKGGHREAEKRRADGNKGREKK